RSLRACFAALSLRHRQLRSWVRAKIRARTATGPSVHQHIAALPQIGAVDALRKQAVSTAERRPIGIVSDHRAQIRPLNRQAAAEVHLIPLDESSIWGLQHT